MHWHIMNVLFHWLKRWSRLYNLQSRIQCLVMEWMAQCIRVDPGFSQFDNSGSLWPEPQPQMDPPLPVTPLCAENCGKKEDDAGISGIDRANM